MNKDLIRLATMACVLLWSCSKSKNSENGPQNSSSVKIEVLSGSGQTDTVGLQLANFIVVKVTQNGNPVSGYSVEFQGSGCNQDLAQSITTQPDGTATYAWNLASDVGQQTLKAYAINSNGQKADSAIATATAIAAGSGWQYSSCSLYPGSWVLNLCKLSTGRIFACYGGKVYLRYSDDNGASWLGVKSLGNTHFIEWALSTPADELLVFADDGTYYSKDEGQTWTTMGAAPSDIDQVIAGVGTPDGKLIVTTKNDISVSIDKGQTWATQKNPGGDEDFASPAEDQNGNIYVDGQDLGVIYKSTDIGKTWVAQTNNSQEEDLCFYIDNNTGWYYKSRFDAAGGIYISKDQGATYSKLFSAPNGFLGQFSVQSDGNYYFEAGSLYQSAGITSVVKPIKAITGLQAYIVAKNGNIVTAPVSDYSTIFYFTK